ncbi:unnamed protein product [Bursaphelenchus xylophilus]|uniref:(pine wood nematode) hypothetical protein n=1 Tax=Bursaphelenchus xylophilus TaxID=6326 RepID=A0A7I8XAZ9_BURXY|nr:unnamed protein product [Bursaphelenchus xylophilus]CAG9132161.1 unnamed protein product [Bursaphelenchus xylophilus]
MKKFLFPSSKFERIKRKVNFIDGVRYAPNACLRSRNLLHNVGTSGQILPPDVCYDTMYTSSSRIHHLKADHQARSIQMTQGMT